jgi:hypothetical protein
MYKHLESIKAIEKLQGIISRLESDINGFKLVKDIKSDIKAEKVEVPLSDFLEGHPSIINVLSERISAIRDDLSNIFENPDNEPRAMNPISQPSK